MVLIVGVRWAWCKKIGWERNLRELEKVLSDQFLDIPGGSGFSMVQLWGTPHLEITSTPLSWTGPCPGKQFYQFCPQILHQSVDPDNVCGQSKIWTTIFLTWCVFLSSGFIRVFRLFSLQRSQIFDSFNLRVVFERDKTGFEESKVASLTVMMTTYI